MKKISIILVMLFWCSVGFAEVLKFECKPNVSGVNHEYLKYEIDTVAKKFNAKWKTVGNEAQDTTYPIVELDNVKVVYVDPFQPKKFKYAWNYGGDGNEYQLKPEHKEYGNSNCKKIDEEKINMASMIDDAKKTCKDLGFKEGTEKFSDCSLKLYSQSVELAAKNNQTVVMQPQSSGSNVMTIYDPVRDSRALMRQGQRMLSGGCTLGINC